MPLLLFVKSLAEGLPVCKCLKHPHGVRHDKGSPESCVHLWLSQDSQRAFSKPVGSGVGRGKEIDRSLDLCRPWEHISKTLFQLPQKSYQQYHVLNWWQKQLLVQPVSDQSKGGHTEQSGQSQLSRTLSPSSGSQLILPPKTWVEGIMRGRWLNMWFNKD